ncbi:2-oxoacid:acceptor oxidoreductase subunit alpha [Gemella bergeri]|nr:2-oxoacid:acceptor oxidoreductase subunit alpha [Gemella bergeri]
MINKLGWKIGGEQGEGLESTAEIFSTAINTLGYYMYSTRDFASRIKGGHSNSKICISEEKINVIDYKTDILIAFDQATLDNYIAELDEHSIIIVDEKIKPVFSEEIKSIIAIFPITDLAKEISNPIIKNIITLGICSALLNIEDKIFYEMIETKFSNKGEEIVNTNIQAFDKGCEIMTTFMNENNIGNKYYLKELKPKEQKNMWLVGNHAAGFGALVAGCRLYSGYPITPATEIMEYLFDKLPIVKGAYVQTEDEIAALGVAIGANFAGVRAMTATSGPGISLMTEFLGMGVMAEQPVVIVDVQRGGPSSGLPTKTEQSDIFHAVYGGTGDASRIVLAPISVEDCFYIMIDAFNMAEKYQTPVIVLMDLQLGMNKETVPNFDFSKVKIDRGQLLKQEDITEEDIIYFKRYATDVLVSDRTIPGQKGGIHNANSYEHSIVGLPSEVKRNTMRQKEKRSNKIENALLDKPFVLHEYNDEKDILLVGVNATYGVLNKAAKQLKEQGMKIDTMQIRQIYPVAQEIRDTFDKYRKIYIVEHNHNKQLRTVIASKYHNSHKLGSLLKYDGDIYYTHQLIEQILEEEK